jgi:hypothetical protein
MKGNKKNLYIASKNESKYFIANQFRTLIYKYFLLSSHSFQNYEKRKSKCPNPTLKSNRFCRRKDMGYW